MGVIKYTKEYLEEIVSSSISVAECLRRMGLRPAGGNYKWIKDRISEYGISTSHFRGQSHGKGRKRPYLRNPSEYYLQENCPSRITSSLLKIKLLEDKIFEHRCYSCGLREWLGNKIPLELEHKNGINNDNRLENLTLLCPNCHAFTDTYRGKNKKRLKEIRENDMA